MDVEYTGRQTTITKKLKLQAEAGLARIAKIVGNSGSVHVILSADKYRQIADVTVQTRHQKLVARCEATEMAIALRDALVKVMNMPEVRKQLAAQGAVPMTTTPQEYRQLMDQESVKWAAVVKKGNITLD